MWMAIAACLGLSLQADPVKLGAILSGTALVEDPGAPGGGGVAVRILEDPGEAAVDFEWPEAAPGMYHVSLPIRIHLQPGFNASLLKMEVAFSDGKAIWLQYPVFLAQLDGSPGAWTVRSQPVILTAPVTRNRITVRWSFVLGPGGKAQSAFEIGKPGMMASDAPLQSPASWQGVSELLDEFGASMPVPLAQIKYPAILVGTPVLERAGASLVVENVWPEKVHVYPGETNPVTVRVRNLGPAPAEATLRLDMLTGLDETGTSRQVEIRIPARSLVTHRFDWVSGTREYGHEARASVLVAGIPVHSASEYFSVSTPIWKTAIQGSGFLSWSGREEKLAPHVEGNRRNYINVEEAFGWQPSSWNDLNPTTDVWSAGQNNFHNSLAGLREWIDRSHSNGIKMITYSWPTVSGKSGFDWGRRYPDLLTRQTGGSGLDAVVDLEDLQLYEVTHSRPEFRDYQSGKWMHIGVNLGFLRSMHLHVQEVIRSARRFGWDGLRFDYPPRWSAMDTSCVQWEFGLLGVTNLMRELLPEYMDTTNSVWSEQAIGARNVRYARHVLKTELGPHFALSYNDGETAPITPAKAFWFREFCREGGQIMNEAIRQTGSMEHYLNVVLWHAEATRAAGGYGNVFQAEKCPAPLASVYSAIFTFAAGSHPYLDYGWASMPGEYTRFMTRYGEYCWDLALAPVTAVAAGLSVEDGGGKPLLWERFLRQRKVGSAVETVVHLINPPEWEAAKAARQHGTGWRRDVVVRKRCETPPTVWLLTAEPSLSATRLTVRPDGESYAVTVPEVRYWSTLVWSEKP